jgi:hypothetical protein
VLSLFLPLVPITIMLSFISSTSCVLLTTLISSSSCALLLTCRPFVSYGCCCGLASL